MRFMRVFGSIVLLVIVVAAAAISALVYFVDPNKLRPVIVEEVMDQTGYQLAIYGRLNWTIYPTLGIHVPRMTLIAPEQTKPFLDLNNLTVAADIRQLIFGKKELLGDVHVSAIEFMNVKMKNARVDLSWQGKKLTLSPISALLYGGKLQGKATGVNLDRIPQWQWDLTASDIQIKPLLNDVNGSEARLSLSGLGHLNFNAKTQGLHKNEILSQMEGKGQLSIKNGEIDGMDIGYLIRSAEALINREPLNLPEKSDHTPFAELNSNISIGNGVAETKNFTFSSPVFTADAQGSLNLLHQGVNFAVQVKPVLGSKKFDWAIPILVTGSVLSPDVRLDTNEIQSYLAKHELQKVKEKVRDEIKQHVPGEAGKVLNNLLGG